MYKIQMCFIKIFRILAFILCSISFKEVSAQQRINLENTYEGYIRETAKDRGRDFPIRYPATDDAVRRQTPFPRSMPFPCVNGTAFGVGRSTSRPTSVHRLRPGDIDVVGALGDSLLAGNGAMEQWAVGTMIENRGVSWAAGGQSNWKEYLTVPNILKMFNPNLTGFSTGTGEFLSQYSQMNVAFPVAADADAIYQAKILVNKMKRDRRINYKEDWKMITIFFGQNDICSGQCFGPAEATPNMHAIKLMRALDYLQDHMPRVFVNLIPVIDPSLTMRIPQSLMCRFFHILFCSCAHQVGVVDQIAQIVSLARKYQYAEEQLIASGRYEKKKDFTVVLQPFMKLFNAPLDPNRFNEQVIDSSYVTYDCFHFSQKGHALAANLLWNNLLEPVGHKNMKLLNYVMEKFRCPTQDAPYLFTNQNTRRFFDTGRQ